MKSYFIGLPVLHAGQFSERLLLKMHQEALKAVQHCLFGQGHYMRNNFKATTAIPAAWSHHWSAVDRRKPLNICIHEKRAHYLPT